MKKIFLLAAIVLAGFTVQAQFTVSKLLGKDHSTYGLGYGLFGFMDFPIAQGNQSIRVELAEFVFYPSKGEKYFTTTADSKGYLSCKVGYKYVFSEDQYGFYLLPSAGYCRVVDIKEGSEPTYGDGFAAAVEAGYALGLGSKGHSLNLGLKLETDRGARGHNINTLGLRLGYAFNMFHPKN